MPAFQVKDFPADLYEDLRACAAAEDRSMAQQSVHILREFLQFWKNGSTADWTTSVAKNQTTAGAFASINTPRTHATLKTLDRNELAARQKSVFDRIHALPKIAIPDDFPSTVDLIHEMRNERDIQVAPELRGAE